MSTEQKLELTKPGIVDLPVTVDELKKKADQFKELKSKLLDDNDYVTINNKKYIKKSAIFSGIFAA